MVLYRVSPGWPVTLCWGVCVLRCLDPSSIYDFFLAQGHICWGKTEPDGSFEKHSLVKVPL